MLDGMDVNFPLAEGDLKYMISLQEKAYAFLKRMPFLI